jgi:hypothetical protein
MPWPMDRDACTALSGYGAGCPVAVARSQPCVTVSISTVGTRWVVSSLHSRGISRGRAAVRLVGEVVRIADKVIEQLRDVVVVARRGEVGLFGAHPSDDVFGDLQCRREMGDVIASTRRTSCGSVGVGHAQQATPRVWGPGCSDTGCAKLLSRLLEQVAAACLDGGVCRVRVATGCS